MCRCRGSWCFKWLRVHWSILHTWNVASTAATTTTLTTGATWARFGRNVGGQFWNFRLCAWLWPFPSGRPINWAANQLCCPSASSYLAWDWIIIQGQPGSQISMNILRTFSALIDICSNTDKSRAGTAAKWIANGLQNAEQNCWYSAIVCFYYYTIISFKFYIIL